MSKARQKRIWTPGGVEWTQGSDVEKLTAKWLKNNQRNRARKARAKINRQRGRDE